MGFPSCPGLPGRSAHASAHRSAGVSSRYRQGNLEPAGHVERDPGAQADGRRCLGHGTGSGRQRAGKPRPAGEQAKIFTSVSERATSSPASCSSWPSFPVNVRDGRYWTPLMISAFDGHQHVAKLLLDHGAHINAKDMAGYTPLHWAAFNGFRDVVDLLIKRGAIIGAQSKFGITPLLQAAAQGHPRRGRAPAGSPCRPECGLERWFDAPAQSRGQRPPGGGTASAARQSLGARRT